MRLVIAAAAATSLAFASLAPAAITIDTFTTTNGTVAYPITDDLNSFAPTAFDQTGTRFGTRGMDLQALTLTGTTAPAGATASLNLDTAAGALTLASTEGVGAATQLSYTATTGTADADFASENSLQIAYTAATPFTVEVTVGNLSGTGPAATAANRSPVVAVDAGTGVLSLPFDGFTRRQSGGGFSLLPNADFSSIDTILVEVRSNASNSSVQLTGITTAVPEPTSALAAVGLGALALRRRRRA